MNSAVQEKKCGSCNTVRPIESFCMDAGKAGGRSTQCRDCKRDYDKSPRAVAERRARNSRPEMREKRKLAQREYCAKDPDGVKARAKEWWIQNKHRNQKYSTKRKVAAFARNLRVKFGLTVAEYESKFKRQNGACAICHEQNLNGHRLAVDHNHATGQIRGLLCRRCNGALGYVRERFDIIRGLHDYLELWARIGAIK